MLRAVEKINYPNLLVSGPVFRVAPSGEYFNMHRLARLEYGPISGASWDNLFFPRPLNAHEEIGFDAQTMVRIYRPL
jgi:hypothetical protein